jgi:glycosyltransferase involved in cell wall biosynthesis
VRALIVAYYYPPISSGGSARPLAMVKHLTRLGHEVSVLTQSYRRPDILEGDELRVYDPSHNRDRVGAGAIAWLSRRLLIAGVNLAGGSHSIYSAWKARVLAHADRLIASARPEVLIASYPPVEDLEIGLALGERFGIPLVADFRDGLLFEPIERERIRRHRSVEEHYRQVERAVAERAAAVVTVFPSLSAYFRDHYRRDDVETISNGFDPEDFAGLPPSGLLDPSACNIVHAGRFAGSYGGRDVRPLAGALTRLLDEAPAAARRLRLHLIGELTARERRCFRGLIGRGLVVEHGLQPRPRALAAMTEADALLLLTAPDRRGSAPGKLFEYLGAGRPILGLTAASFAEEIIRSTATGWTVDPADSDGIAGLLRRVVGGELTFEVITPDRERIAEYSRERLLVRLDGILRRVRVGG